MTWKYFGSRNLRLALVSLALLGLLVARWVIWTRLAAPCGSLDRRLGRSGCMAVHRAPWFVGAIKSHPTMVFTPDGRRIAMVGIEVDPVGLSEVESDLLGVASAWSPDDRVLAVEARVRKLADGEGVALFRVP
jgi:hypothetical protein